MGMAYLDLRPSGTQTRLMAHIYMTFDFGTDEEKAQLARHKLDGWKQAFRLDKKLLYKFERSGQDGGSAPAEPAPEKNEPAKSDKSVKSVKAGKAGGGAKAKTKSKEEEKPAVSPVPNGPVKLHLRLAFSGHEKMSEERWVKRIPAEEPFKEVGAETVKPSDASFAEEENRFEALEG